MSLWGLWILGFWPFFWSYFVVIGRYEQIYSAQLAESYQSGGQGAVEYWSDEQVTKVDARWLTHHQFTLGYRSLKRTGKNLFKALEKTPPISHLPLR